MYKGLVILLVIMLVAASGCKPVAKEDARIREVKKSVSESVGVSFVIPALSGFDGAVIDLNAYEGKVILLDFWATWCPPCRYELPMLSKMYNELKDQGFVIIGMTVDRGDKAKIQEAVKGFSLSYPAGLADEKVQAAYGGIRAVPTKFLLDRKGNVLEKFTGVVPEEELRQLITKALAK